MGVDERELGRLADLLRTKADYYYRIATSLRLAAQSIDGNGGPLPITSGRKHSRPEQLSDFLKKNPGSTQAEIITALHIAASTCSRTLSRRADLFQVDPYGKWTIKESNKDPAEVTVEMG